MGGAAVVLIALNAPPFSEVLKIIRGVYSFPAHTVRCIQPSEHAGAVKMHTLYKITAGLQVTTCSSNQTE